MKKAWHIIDEAKSQYFLVTVLPHQPNSTKIPIQYQKEKYFVNQQQLLSYSSQKSKHICDIQENNLAQIINWIKHSFQESGFWVKVNKKLIIDFNKNTAKQRYEFMRFIFGRFLVSEKRRQYLCMANDQTMCNMNGSMIKTIFDVMGGITHLWKYKISLKDLSKIYGIFFRDIPMKMKIFVKNDEIIRMAIIPYSPFPKQLLGREGNSEVMTLTARIFNVMANSTKQLKNYYRVPHRSAPTQDESQNLEDLTNFLLHIGFTVLEIKEIISIFSLIMNINCLQFSKCRKTQKLAFRMKDGSIIKDNIRHLIGQDFLIQLQKEFNSVENINEVTRESILLRQQLIMRIIYEQMMAKVAELLNEKMCNISTTFDDYKQFILVEFPPLKQHFQNTVEHYNIDLINNKIQALGLDLPFNKQTHQFKSKIIFQQIKEQYDYDINKGILENMKKSLEWVDKLAKSEFMQKFKIAKINSINKDSSKQRVGKIEDLFEELQGLESDKEYFINYIIQTSVNQKNVPIKTNLIKKIQESIHLKRQKDALKEQTIKNGMTKKEEQEDESADLIEIKMEVFSNRYAYCQLLKQIYRKKTNLADSLEKQFQEKKMEAKVSKNRKQVLLSTNQYQQFQRQRSNHDIVINKIKKQFKAAKFRHSICANLKKLYAKIKLNAFILKKIAPYQKYTFVILRRRLATLRMYDNIIKGQIALTKIAWKQIRISAGINLLFYILKNKQPIIKIKKLLIQNLKKIHKTNRANKLTNKLIAWNQKKKLKIKRQFLKKLSQQYEIIVNPPQNIRNYKSLPDPPPKTEEVKKVEPQPSHQSTRAQIKQTQPNQNNPINISPVKKEEKGNPAAEPPSSPPLPPPQSPPPQLPAPVVNKIEPNKPNEARQQAPSNTPPPESKQVQSEPSNQKYNSNNQSNDYSSFGNSTNRGIEKSEVSRKLTEPEFLSLKDNPKFTFETWLQLAVGFKKRKPAQTQNIVTAKDLFNKSTPAKQAHKEAAEQLNVDILIKEKVVVNPFFPYLMEHITAETEEKLQKIMSHQDKIIKEPLLSLYPKEKYPKVPTQTFNNILKIGLDKNTSKSKAQLLNMIVKSIKETYHNEKSNISTVFEGEPAIITDYSWDHNLVKDEIFMQFIKQIMMNQKEESLHSLAAGLQILTRYYYPSPKFLYPFLHFLKSLQSKNIQKLNQSFVNTLLFAQVYERYKGSNVTVFKSEIFPKQKQSHPCLEPRLTQITDKQILGCLSIVVRFLNDEAYEYTVRNQTISHFKRKALKEIHMLNYEEYFGVYYSPRPNSHHYIISETKKAIDFLNQYPQTKTEHLLYVKLKYYFPFNIKQINKTRIMYLNSVAEEKHLPWKPTEYENIVVLSMLFDQFQEERISNYLIMTNQVQGNVDLTPIQNRYSSVANSKSKKISELQYFKQVKECGFLGAKAYRIKDENEDSYLSRITKVVTKPLQLCFYRGDQLKSSISLQRIKGYGLDKGQLHIEIDYVDEESHRGMRNITLRHVDRVHELYADLAAYIGYLSPH